MITFCMRIAIAPTHIVGRLPISATGFRPIVAVPSFFGAASTWSVVSVKGFDIIDTLKLLVNAFDPWHTIGAGF